MYNGFSTARSHPEPQPTSPTNAEAAYAQRGKAMLELLGQIDEEPEDFQFNFEEFPEEDND